MTTALREIFGVFRTTADIIYIAGCLFNDINYISFMLHYLQLYYTLIMHIQLFAVVVEDDV